MNKIDYALASELAERVIERYSREEIDSVYLLYNEFKSVIAQRLVVEQILPIEQIGEPEVQHGRRHDRRRERDTRLEAAKDAGVGIRPADTRDIDAAAAKFATAPVDYIYEQSPEELFRSLLPKYVAIQIFHASAGIGGGGARGPHDRHGCGHQQRHRHDRFADAGHEPGAPGEDHERDHRDCERSAAAQ